MKKILFLLMLIGVTIGVSVSGGTDPTQQEQTEIDHHQQYTNADLVADFSVLNYSANWVMLRHDNFIMIGKDARPCVFTGSHSVYNYPLLCYRKNKRINNLVNTKLKKTHYSQLGYSMKK